MNNKPEIDPELAAMEASSPHVQGLVGRMIQGRRAAAGRAGKRSMQEPKSIGRRAQRALVRADGLPQIPQGRIRSGAKLAKSKMQQEIEYRAVVRKMLWKIKLELLLPDVPDLRFVIGQPGLRNVWQLCQAPTGTIHEIPGLGPARRKKIRAYLIGKDVPVAWEA